MRKSINLIHNNPYILLAQFLSPWKNEADIIALGDLIDRGNVDWGTLLQMANLQLCTPLWYVRLQQDGLLSHLPAELTEYLANIYQLNLERNREIISATKELLDELIAENIPTLLLKGAATFCDDLYRDTGARMMEDIDLLAHPEDTQKIKKILIGFGFQELHNQDMTFDNLPTDDRHHHLQAYDKPGTGVKIEVHYRLAYAQAGSVLPVDTAWAHAEQTVFEGLPTRILNPTLRLLHNTVHALLPDCEFIRSSVSLRQLTEFSCLIKKYRSVISWQDWLGAGSAKGLNTEFLTYLTLANRLQGTPLPAGIKPSARHHFHAARIAAIGKRGYTDSLATEKNTLTRLVITILLRCYYYLSLPAWVWHNVCYTAKDGQTLVRLGFLLKKIRSPRSRARI